MSSRVFSQITEEEITYDLQQQVVSIVDVLAVCISRHEV
jgi:hypothetical protein